jgi:hypothetical protein
MLASTCSKLWQLVGQRRGERVVDGRSSTNHGNLANEGLSLLFKIRLFAGLHVEVVEVRLLAGVD